LYIPSTGPYPPEYRNIGIRIEDNIAIGKTSPIVLTVEAPKEVDDIEAVCAGLVGVRDR
jgi:intermediate cleaving peptidase 55